VREPVPAGTGNSVSSARRSLVRRRAIGFTLVEVLIAIAIMAILAAAVIPTIQGRLASARADAIIGELQSLQNGVMLFYRDVGRYPQRLDYLTALPAGANDLCGKPIQSANSSRYRGPYVTRPINTFSSLTSGVEVFTIGTGDEVDVVAKVAANVAISNGGAHRALQLWMESLESTVADDIDFKVDGRKDSFTGLIRYESGILKWSIPIAAGAC
jgi:general secretion pathway protein G